MPSVDRSTKPVHFTQTQSDMTSSQNKYGLKPVRVPISISQRFAESAKSNTLRNIETCGILFGKLVSPTDYTTTKSVYFFLCGKHLFPLLRIGV